ncbi:WecB/TagA/CpsF family glycosyltransferase [Rhodococcus sp. 3A]
MHHIAQLEVGSPIDAAYHLAKFVVADGWPVVSLARRLGNPLRGRTTGSGLITRVSKCAVDGRRAFIIGGSTESSGIMLAEKMRARGWLTEVDHFPVGSFGSVEAHDRLYRAVERFEPDLVIVGIGTPRQEILAVEISALPGNGWILCVGAGVDYAAGARSRSPVILQRLGLEWMYRIAREPNRLLLRYLRDVPPFVAVARRSTTGRSK